MSDETYLSYAVVDAAGVVVGGTPYAINTRLAPGGRVIATLQDAADYLAGWAPSGPHQTVHVWSCGGVATLVGGTLDNLRPADASAESAVTA